METLVLNLVSTSVLDTSCPELSIPLMVTALREINRVIVSEQQVEDFLRNRHIPKQFTSANRAKVHTIVTRALVELKLKEHRDEVCNELVALKSREPDKVSAFLIRANAESAAKCSTADTHLKKALQKGFLSPSKGPVCNSENMLNLAATAAPTAASSSGLVSQSLINPLAMDNVINLPNGSVKAGVGHLSTFASYWYACTRGEKPFLVLIFWCPLGSEVAVNFLPSEASDKTTIVATWTFPAFHDLLPGASRISGGVLPAGLNICRDPSKLVLTFEAPMLTVPVEQQVWEASCESTIEGARSPIATRVVYYRLLVNAR